MVAAVAPALFSANASGKGAAAADFIPDALFPSVWNLVYSCSTAVVSPCTPMPLDVSAGTAVLVLFGTGIANRSSLSAVTVSINGQSLPASHAGPAPGAPGEDQINVSLPTTLLHAGVVPVTVSIGATASNAVTVWFK